MFFSLVPFAQRCVDSLWQAIKQALRQLTKPADNHSLALNAALVLFLVAWRQRDRQSAPEPVAIVPLQVVETDLEETEPETPDAPDEPAPTEPPPEPPLPEPPPPEIAVAEPPLDAPQPPPIEIALTHTADVPLFAAEVVVPPPAPPPPPKPKPPPPRPKPRPAPKPRPKPKPQPPPRRGVTRTPTLVEPPDLSAYYPRRARMRGTTGQSTIKLTILEDGRVADVQVLSSTPPGIFDRAAERVGKVLRFRPALRDDRRVAASATVNLVWQLEE